MTNTFFSQHPWLLHLGQAVVILVIAGLVIRIGSHILERIGSRSLSRDSQLKARRQTLFTLLSSVLRYGIDFIALITILDFFGIPTTSLVASAGILGLAISFGAQGLVQDIVTGLFLLYEDQFAVGDQITLPALALSGTVTDLGLRITRLKGVTGEVVILPNRLIMEVQNHTRGQGSVSIAIPISADENPQDVAAIFEKIVDSSKEEFPGLALQGITSVLPGQVVWSITAPSGYGDMFAKGNDLRQRLIKALHTQGIALAGTWKGANGTTHGQTAI